MMAQNLAMRQHQAGTTVSNSEPRVSTALICESLLLRAGLQYILSGTPFMIAEEFPSEWPGLISQGAQEPTFVIFATNRVPSGMLQMVWQTKERFPEARIVVLADHLDLGFVQHGHSAGVEGFCLTGSSREVLITSLELIMLRAPVLPSALVQAVFDGKTFKLRSTLQNTILAGSESADSRQGSLSGREAAILTHLMEGASNKDIARKLDLAERTVKVHVKAILRKVGATNRTQAAMWAMAHLPARTEASLHG
jgi:two-component system nitrate/nitrite response regulator NarL